MTRGELMQMRKWSAEDQRTFDRWLKANMIVSAIIGSGILAMALGGSKALELREARAQATATQTAVTPQDEVFGSREFFIRATPTGLLDQQFDAF